MDQALAELIRAEVLDATGTAEDWDSVIDTYERRSVIDPSQPYGASLLSQLMIAKQQVIDHGSAPERLQAVARLAQLYGLFLGNQDKIASARGWYRTAAAVADQSGDIPTRVYVRGRALSRGIYEGYGVQETIDGAAEALSITRTSTPGALESYSALVHAHALTGNLTQGRRAVMGMHKVTDGLPTHETEKAAGPIQRTVLFNSYLECRIGTLRDAERAYSEAEPLLHPIPLWIADATVYRARAHVRAGDVSQGLALALDAVKSLGPEVRILRLGVKDLISVVPVGHRSDELDELGNYAETGPAPWETLTS
jgi:hypothetical protein